MSTVFSQVTQDYWMNSLAIGHPLAFHSSSITDEKPGDVPNMDDNNVSHLCSKQT